MPLLDHFHPPLAPRRHWESFHVNWAGAIADALNESLLPDGYFAEEHAHLGPFVEIDVATYTDSETSAERAGGTATLPARAWAPPAPPLVVPAAFPDAFEVLVFESEGGSRLVAAIELVSPGNKDRDGHRQAFAIKCASYLCQGVSLIVIDIVTSRRANLHNEIVRLLGHGEQFTLSAETNLYAVAYRPIVRDQRQQIEIWPSLLEIGNTLPLLPLSLNAELCLPIDLEASYAAACQRRRLT
jgi:Protein of unknown function (DUF4058)